VFVSFGVLAAVGVSVGKGVLVSTGVDVFKRPSAVWVSWIAFSICSCDGAHEHNIAKMTINEKKLFMAYPPIIAYQLMIFYHYKSTLQRTTPNDYLFLHGLWTM